MGLIWKESENEFLVRYQKIRKYFKMYKNNEMSSGDYEALKTQQLNIDNIKTSVCELDDEQYNGIMLEALLDIDELYRIGAITKTEYETQLRKVRLRKSSINVPPDFFK